MNRKWLPLLGLTLLGCYEQPIQNLSLPCEPAPNLQYLRGQLRFKRFPLIGAGQGLEVIGDKLFVFGDAGRGVIQELDRRLQPTGWAGSLTRQGVDLITHPVGIANRPGFPAFIGSGDGSIFHVDWQAFRRDGNLDGAVLQRIEDSETPDQYKGTRPEYVELNGRWLVATSDYADATPAKQAEVRLMDPLKLARVNSTDQPGVIIHRFPVSPYVQSLYWLESKKLLVLVQNITNKAIGWKLTFLDLEAAVEQGSGQGNAVITTVCFPYESELEGYGVLNDGRELLITPGELYFGSTGVLTTLP